MDISNHTVSIPLKDYEELKNSKHKELEKFLQKLYERRNIRISGIELGKTPITCNVEGPPSEGLHIKFSA